MAICGASIQKRMTHLPDLFPKVVWLWSYCRMCRYSTGDNIDTCTSITSWIAVDLFYRKLVSARNVLKARLTSFSLLLFMQHDHVQIMTSWTWCLEEGKPRDLPADSWASTWAKRLSTPEGLSLSFFWVRTRYATLSLSWHPAGSTNGWSCRGGRTHHCSLTADTSLRYLLLILLRRRRRRLRLVNHLILRRAGSAAAAAALQASPHWSGACTAKDSSCGVWRQYANVHCQLYLRAVLNENRTADRGMIEVCTRWWARR